MKISDRTLGYLSIILLLMVFVVVAYSMYEAHHESTKTALVDFEELGTLQPEDQVVIRGYTVGTVGTVTWLGDRARVEIKFSEPVIIREGTRFNNVNYAIMGQRRLEIIPSKNGKVLPEDFVHSGHFEPGIAEVLRYIENVNDQMAVIRSMVHLVLEGDSSHKSAPQMLEAAMETIEGTIVNAEKMLAALQPTVNNIFAQVDTASQTLIRVTNQVDTAVKTATDAVNQKIALAEDAIRKISEGAAHTNDIITSIEQNPLTDKYLNSAETVEKLKEIIDKFYALATAINPKDIKVLDDNGNPVKLFTWKNVNLIGDRANDKARKRLEEAAKAKKDAPK